MRLGTWAACLLTAVVMNGAAIAAESNGAGSTFVFPILAKWAEAYKAKTGNVVAYQSVGSGQGIASIKAATVDFGASDMPLSPDELKKHGLGQFPLVIGGVVPVVNIEGIAPGELRFSGALLADIFLGKVRRWDDPAIRQLNPQVRLPSSAITVVHRSDASGTTFNWANYLSKVSAEWKQQIGEGTTVDWPVGVAGKGNDGVAALVEQVGGAIGYVEYAYVLRSNLNKLKYALVQNKAGAFVGPTLESFQAAAQTADWSKADEFFLVMTDAPGQQAYPITASAFMVMYKEPKNPGGAAVAIDFFKWALQNGQQDAQALHYVPLPPQLISLIESYWKAAFNIKAGL